MGAQVHGLLHLAAVVGAGGGGGIGHAGGVLFVGDALELIHVPAGAEAKAANGHHVRPLVQRHGGKAPGLLNELAGEAVLVHGDCQPHRLGGDLLQSVHHAAAALALRLGGHHIQAVCYFIQGFFVHCHYNSSFSMVAASIIPQDGKIIKSGARKI